MNNVIKLREETLPDEPDADLIAKLEELLEMAKSGQLRGMAYATVKSQLVLGTGWSGTAGTRYPLSGAIGMLHTRYFNALLEPGEKVE
jgi:hypothetical protein